MKQFYYIYSQILNFNKVIFKNNYHLSSFCLSNNNVEYFYKFWKRKFFDCGISEPRESIENILAHVLQTSKINKIYQNMPLELNNKQINEIDRFCQLRIKRMPLQYVIGEWDFRDLTLKMMPPVFIPRPETEMLVDIVLEDLQDIMKPIRLLEICCGTGAISLALLKSNSNISVMAIDQSLEACQLTKQNAAIHRLEKRLIVRHFRVTHENQLQDIDEKFDIIVSNPPYVPTADLLNIQPEIKLYEDLAALDGGKDGLDLIKIILSVAQEKLVTGGKLYLETDPSHPIIITKIVEESFLYLKYMKTYKDFCNKDRFVKIQKI